VIGLGYVGLSLAVCLATKGFRVTGYDVDQNRVKRINGGKPPFYAPRLEGLLRSALRKGFKASTKISLHTSTSSPWGRQGAMAK
jgi:UDPglucose 6-dehydrogenase